MIFFFLPGLGVTHETNHPSSLHCNNAAGKKQTKKTMDWFDNVFIYWVCDALISTCFRLIRSAAETELCWGNVYLRVLRQYFCLTLCLFVGFAAQPSSACVCCPALASVSATWCGRPWPRTHWQLWPLFCQNYISLLWTGAWPLCCRWFRPVRINMMMSFTMTLKDMIKNMINSLIRDQ